VRFHWLLSSCLGAFLFCSPAKAGQILSWEFEEQNNNLVFTTDEGVQPKAQLLNNPTRLVIDLPGTSLGQETVKESYQGAIRGFRIGQPEPDTSRIVIEFAPGYTIDSNEVEFRGISPTEWTVNLPEPRIAPVSTAKNFQSEEISLPPVRPLPPLLGSESESEIPQAKLVSTSTSSSLNSSPYIKPTSIGFFIAIDGSRKNEITPERNGDRIDFTLEGVTLPTDLASQSIAVNQYGVSEIEFTQTASSPPEARMSLKVAEGSPDWLATFSRIKGLILVPRGELPTEGIQASVGDTSEENESETESIVLDKLKESTEEKAVIDEIELVDDDGKLLIRGDRELTAVTSKQDNGIYEIRIDNAELAEDLEGPELKAGSPISQLRIRQDGTAVVMTVTTRLRYRLGQISPDENAIAFPIEIGASLLPENDTPLMPPELVKIPKVDKPRFITAPLPMSDRISSDRPKIVIDPGHGGDDSGAVGIDGLREKDIILPISLDVAEILKKQNIEVVLTRDSDYFISLEGRTDLANRVDADLFVSIHANAISLSRPDVSGLETYYYDSGRRLAELIHWSVLNGVNINDRSIRRARFYVLRHSAMPAVLVEVGFVTGAEDASRLSDPDHRHQMAEAIARGIIEYIKQNQL
jgi:N-acetylmuramoyl-L-alanine amidase